MSIEMEFGAGKNKKPFNPDDTAPVVEPEELKRLREDFQTEVEIEDLDDEMDDRLKGIERK